MQATPQKETGAERTAAPVSPVQRNVQEGPWPDALFELVDGLAYRDGWRIWLTEEDRSQGCIGLTLVVRVATVNSYEPHEDIHVRHLFPVPAAAYDRDSWQRWLFEQLLLVERHEAMEFFTIAGEKPFAPVHAPGADPYTVTQLSTRRDRRTAFDGRVNE